MLDADARALGVPEITSVVAQIDSRMATLAADMDDVRRIAALPSSYTLSTPTSTLPSTLHWREASRCPL